MWKVGSSMLTSGIDVVRYCVVGGEACQCSGDIKLYGGAVHGSMTHAWYAGSTCSLSSDAAVSTRGKQERDSGSQTPGC